MTIGAPGVANGGIEHRRAVKALRIGQLGCDFVPLEEIVIDFREHAVGRVFFGRVDEVVVLQKRSDVGIGQRIVFVIEGKTDRYGKDMPLPYMAILTSKTSGT
jgi:hypothetical protein